MTTATITQAQDKGLRHQFGALLEAVRDFSAELYTAHGGWLQRRAGGFEQGRRQLMALAAESETYSPSLSAELRNLASKG
jgi:hypothetical protein